MKNQNADEIIDRLKGIMKVDTDIELANKLGISRQAIAAARKFERVPNSWLRRVSNDYGVALDWLKDGIGAPPIINATPNVVGCGAPIGLGTTPGWGLYSLASKFIDSLDKIEIGTGCSSTDKKSQICQICQQIEAFYAPQIASMVSQKQALEQRTQDLEIRLQESEKERRELANENREIIKENRDLWAKNSELIARSLAKLEKSNKQGAPREDSDGA